MKNLVLSVVLVLLPSVVFADEAIAGKRSDVVGVSVDVAEATGIKSDLAIQEVIRMLSEGDLPALKDSIDYEKMHKAYLAQMYYISAKIKGLSATVENVAAGTFETRVREGSMMLGLLSEQVGLVVDDISKNKSSFREFIDGKLMSYSLADAEMIVSTPEMDKKLDNGLLIHLIEVKSPMSDLPDIITVTESDGKLTLVAYLPSDVADMNNVLNGLIKRASAASVLSDELERMALINSSIGLPEFSAPSDSNQSKESDNKSEK